MAKSATLFLFLSLVHASRISTELRVDDSKTSSKGSTAASTAAQAAFDNFVRHTKASHASLLQVKDPTPTCSAFLQIAEGQNMCPYLSLMRTSHESLSSSECTASDIEAVCGAGPSSCGAAMNAGVEAMIEMMAHPPSPPEGADEADTEGTDGTITQSTPQLPPNFVRGMYCGSDPPLTFDQTPRQCADLAEVQSKCGDCTMNGFAPTEACSHPFSGAAKLTPLFPMAALLALLRLF